MVNDVPSWKTTQVQPRTEFEPGTGPIEGFRVYYTTDTGLNGYVFVPAARIGNRQEVAAAIQESVEKLHAIHTLTG